MSFGFDAKEVLTSRAHDIVGLAFRGLSKPQNVHATVLLSDPHRSEIGLEADGAKARVVFFDLDSDVGLLSARREISITSRFVGKNLLPDIKGFADDHSFLASDCVEGDSVIQMLNTTPLDIVASMLGAWARSFFDLSVAEPCDGNWYEYLSDYEAFQDSGAVRQHVDYLRALTFSEKRIAQNQARLDRYIKTTSGNLIAFDMANAAVKPPKWDLLLMARELVQQYSGQVDTISTGLAEGWHGEAKSADYKSTVYLIKLFAVHSTLKPLKKNKGKLARALDNYNSERARKVTKAFLTPYQQNFLTDLHEEERAEFRAHLMAELHKAEQGEIGAVTKQFSLPESDTATQFLKSMCATCRGFCCTPGRDKHAFITAPEIVATADQKYDGNLKAAAEYYSRALPEKHIEGSCLYHTAEGCVLPREARSSICNTYYCQPAKTVFESLSRSGNTKEVLFLARDGLSGDGYTARVDPKTKTVLSERFNLDK